MGDSQDVINTASSVIAGFGAMIVLDKISKMDIKIDEKLDEISRGIDQINSRLIKLESKISQPIIQETNELFRQQNTKRNKPQKRKRSVFDLNM